MKNLISLSFAFLAILIFSFCSSAQKMQKNIPFSIQNVYYQKWAAGIEEAGSGMNLYIQLENELTQGIKMDSVYFRGKSTKIIKNTNNPLVYEGSFINKSNNRKDIIMSGDPIEEFGNEIPFQTKSFPFELEDNECIISYWQDHLKKYFKIYDVKERQEIHYPTIRNK